MTPSLGQRDATLYYEQIDYEVYEDLGHSKKDSNRVNFIRRRGENSSEPRKAAIG